MINRKGFFWHLYPSFVFLTLISVGAVTWYTYRAMYSFYIRQVTSELLSRARMAASAFDRGRCFFISRRISIPIIRMQQTAEDICGGNLDTKVPVAGPYEIGKLAESINKMVEGLRSQIQQVNEHRNQLETIFGNMTEGVVALGREERIVSINRAAAQILGLEGKSVEGKAIQEMIRDTKLQKFISKVYHSQAALEIELTLEVRNEERIIRACLKSEKGNLWHQRWIPSRRLRPVRTGKTPQAFTWC